jgi:sarcosine oxidase
VDRADVVVVGAGVMGSATAAALAARGVETTLLEQFPIGHARGSSHGPTRIFRLSYPHSDYTMLARRALRSWRALEEDAGESLLVTTGGLDVGSTASDCRESLEDSGVPFEWLSSSEAGERFPGISFEGIQEILYQPDAGVCLADRTVAAQVRLARERGVDVRDETEVESMRPHDEGVRLRTSKGEIEAKVVVLTAGSWAAGLLSGAGLPSLPLSPVLQHVSYFAGATDIPTFIDWTGPELSWYALPPAGEAQGVKVGAHVGGVPINPLDGPFEVDPAGAAVHAEYVRRRFPRLEPQPVRTETCLYTMTPDEDFILDRVGPVVIGSPCSGHGFKFGPLIGELLADMAMGIDPELPGRRFAIDRPALRNRGGAVTIVPR